MCQLCGCLSPYISLSRHVVWKSLGLFPRHQTHKFNSEIKIKYSLHIQYVQCKKKCVYWSDCLTSLFPPGLACSLCFAIRAIKTSPLFPPGWNTSFFSFPVANQTPTGLTKSPSKARALPPLCSGRLSRGVVPNQVTDERRYIHREQWIGSHFLHTHRNQRKKYSTPSALV